MTMSNKDRNAEKLMEDPEYGLDSRYQSENERVTEAKALTEARSNRMKNMLQEQILQARLMQLKYRMEAYIQQPVYDDSNYFSEFLEFYIDNIYPKRNQFASDMDITPVKLSQVINNHREPKDEFIRRLMVHSEKVYKQVGDFDPKIWYQVYLHEKLCDTMASQDKWKPKIEKQIKYSQPI
jgi:hypothetical protein